MKFIPAPAALLILSGCVTPVAVDPAPENEIPWSEVPALVKSCDVDTVYQGHDRWVTLTMRDGTRYQTRSPRLDDIVHVLGDTACQREVGIIME